MPARRSPGRTPAGGGQKQGNIQRKNTGTVIGYDQIRSGSRRDRAGAEQARRQKDVAAGQAQVEARRRSLENTAGLQPAAGKGSPSGSRRTHRPSGREELRYGGMQDRARARARARKRKWRRQRRMLFGGVFLLVLLFAGVGIYKTVRHRQIEKEKQGFLEEGILAMDGGNYEEAIVKLDSALQWSKETVGAFEKDVLMNRAEAEYRLQDYDAAMHTYELLRENDKENEDYKMGVAACLLAKGDIEGALALGVADGYAYNCMAVKQMEAKEYDLALETIEKGLACGSGEALRLLSYNQAVAWENKGYFGKALELYEAYEAQYGSQAGPELESAKREIQFLKTRQGSTAGAETGGATEGSPNGEPASLENEAGGAGQGTEGGGQGQPSEAQRPGEPQETAQAGQAA